jgi:hypothetical protein
MKKRKQPHGRVWDGREQRRAELVSRCWCSSAIGWKYKLRKCLAVCYQSNWKSSNRGSSGRVRILNGPVVDRSPEEIEISCSLVKQPRHGINFYM